MDTPTRHEQTIFEQGIERERKRIVAMLDKYKDKHAYKVYEGKKFYRVKDIIEELKDMIEQEGSG